jgi:hypothetical protein
MLCFVFVSMPVSMLVSVSVFVFVFVFVLVLSCPVLSCPASWRAVHAGMGIPSRSLPCNLAPVLHLRTYWTFAAFSLAASPEETGQSFTLAPVASPVAYCSQSAASTAT